MAVPPSSPMYQRVEDRRHLLGELRDRERPAVDQHRDGRLAERDHGVDQLLLLAR